MILAITVSLCNMEQSNYVTVTELSWKLEQSL
jgi:hypothetical protein